jgi:hypothetical protein
MRSNPILTAIAIALLLSAQFTHVSHVHADLGELDKSEHESRPHVHVGHSHDHPHSHSHSHASPAKAQKTSKSTKVNVPASVAEHDQNALYLNTVVALATTSSTPFKVQLVDIVLYSCGNDRLEVLPNVVPQLQHPPDLARPLATYLLKQAILC